MNAKKCCGWIFTIIMLSGSACKKFLEAVPPKNEVLSEAAFKDSATALSALLNIYAQFSTNGGTIESYFAPYPSLYADELIPVTTTPDNLQYYSNALRPDNGVNAGAWKSLYFVIFECNALLEGMQESSLPQSLQQQFSAEVLTLRAFAYFLLLNSYGDVPLVLKPSVSESADLPRALVAEVYAQLISDLAGAVNSLSENYPDGEKTRINKWAAEALLSRIYLYTGNWKEAESTAGNVIQTGLYMPLEAPAKVFLKNSSETILAFYNKDGYSWSGTYFQPFFGTLTYALTPELLASFKPDDLRKQDWLDSIEQGGKILYYPVKYRNSAYSKTNEGEYTVALRVAEEYLIRAEARARQNRVEEAAEDLNVIRTRAGLTPLTLPISADSCIAFILMERRRELFTEWGLRFFDLKRTGRADAVLGAVKPAWQPAAALFPLPQPELNTNPNLVQNPGY